MGESKEIIGFMPGVFDLTHAGHFLAFKEAKGYCDKLIVGLQVDPTLDRPYKNKPVLSVFERITMLEGCKYVDDVIIYTTEEELYGIDASDVYSVRFMGDDHSGKSHPHIKNKIVVYLGRDHEFSSTSIRNRCKYS